MPKTEPQLIIPFAKPSGMTSFASLRQVKHALGTKKVGHTGTLDGFADGLLILLSGKLTKLVPYIMEFDKTYLALFYFGSETDTLDPEGTIIAKKPLPLYADFLTAVDRMKGTIEQLPPAYSAVKQGGERLSDKARRGETVIVPPRTVTIYDIIIDKIFYADRRVQDFAVDNVSVSPKVSGAVLRVRCSKGTYVRSLIRDIARHCGSAAYVYALRRMAVGPFTLAQAVGASVLPPFGKDAVCDFGSPADMDTGTDIQAELKRAAVSLSMEVSAAMGFQTVSLREEYYFSFINGKPISRQWFVGKDVFSKDDVIAVFYHRRCVGLIKSNDNGLCYQTVFGFP